MFGLFLKAAFSFVLASASLAMFGIWDGQIWLGTAAMVFILTSITLRKSDKTKRM